MKLYYTGATDFEQPQSNPLLSLGGYISSSPVQNASISNLFGSISQKALKNGSREIRAVVLKNELAQPQNVQLYYDNVSKEPVSSLMMALVSPAQDDCGGLYIEKVDRIYNRPVSGLFIDNRGESNALTFTIQPSQFIAVWIERIVNRFQGNQLLSCDNMILQFDSESNPAQVVATFNDNQVIGSYWTFDTVDSKVYVWYDDQNEPTPVVLQDREGIRVPIDIQDTAIQIATKTLNALNSTIGARAEVVVSQSGVTLTIDYTQPGKVNQPTSDTQSVSVSMSQGSSSDQEVVEQIQLILQY